MSATREGYFFNRLSRTSRVIVMAAIFALFAPLPLILTAPIGLHRSWLQIAAWFVLGGSIATTWAYFYFAQRLLWLPPIVTAVLALAFPIVDRWAFGSPVSSTLPVSIAAVVLVVSGYVGFVIFIGIEGTKTVRLQAEMEIAQKIHSYLVPTISFQSDLYEIAGISIASGEMGGDVTDVTQVNDRVCVTIADVSGHGVPAGILMAALKGSLLTSLSTGDATAGDGMFLNRVNATFHRISSPDMYCTLSTVILNGDGSCDIYNAGHTDTLHYRCSTRTLDLVPSTGIPVGVLGDLPCEARRVDLQPGDVLVLLTDGITETEDPEGRMLGIDAVAKLLPEVAESTAEHITQRILGHASAFGASDDDRSVMAIKVKPVRSHL